MYIIVKLFNGFKKPLTYAVPEDWDNHPAVGSIVLVPLRQKSVHAIVISVQKFLKNKPSFDIKPACRIETFPQDKNYLKFINVLGNLYQVDPFHFVKRIKQFLSSNGKTSGDHGFEPRESEQKIELTAEQTKVVDFLLPNITTQKYTPTVLHGVTGSGKTECYKKLVSHCISQNKSAILLLPEVSLATTFLNILKSQMPEIMIHSFHSAVSAKEKRNLWQHLILQKPMLIIGVHLPILLPIPNLGLIIVDEEHEAGFQEKKHPKINSKDSAILRAQLLDIPILLGSATPSVSSLHNVKTKGWKLFKLNKRFIGSFPKVEIVSLKDKKQRKSFWISKELYNALAQCLRKKEQAIIFINRRGYSFFVQCKKCSFIFECSRCSVSLTLHENNSLQCHYCGINKQQPEFCPSCENNEFIKKGVGTQQMVSIIQRLFPDARIERADLDKTTNKKNWQKIVKSMQEGHIDILVGTQTLTKGYHFPNVTLVGIIWADLNLNFPLYNASETSLQQLVQVAGRAGRNTKQSRVIVQSMIEHRIFQYVNEERYIDFYNDEIEQRAVLGYPPFMRLVEIELKNKEENIVEQDAQTFATRLMERSGDLVILGPAKPPLHKLKSMYTRKIYIKGNSLLKIINLFEETESTDLDSSVFFTQNPLTL